MYWIWYETYSPLSNWPGTTRPTRLVMCSSNLIFSQYESGSDIENINGVEYWAKSRRLRIVCSHDGEVIPVTSCYEIARLAKRAKVVPCLACINGQSRKTTKSIRTTYHTSTCSNSMTLEQGEKIRPITGSSSFKAQSFMDRSDIHTLLS